MAALLGLDSSGGKLHRARDLNREAMKTAGSHPESPELLIRTHSLRGGAGRHFDHLFATSEFTLDRFQIDLDGALEAATDHAVIIADLEWTGS